MECETIVSNYKSLAIVGNGFDLQLGIKSRFVDFANSVHFPELDDFKKLCDDLVTDDDTVDTTRIYRGFSNLFELSGHPSRNKFRKSKRDTYV